MKRAIYILAACLMAWIAMPQHTDAQTLRNASNATIGKADGVNKQYAAAVFFFFFKL